MKTLVCLLAVAASCVLTTTAHAEKFVAKFTFREYLTNAVGKVTFATDTTAVDVTECAVSVTPALDPKTLVLVYDTVADEVQVVKKSDGSVVCTVFAFDGGTTVTSADGKKQVRQAFLFLPDHGTNALGSITGTIARTFDAQSNLTGFVWHARFQASIPQDNEVIDGQLTTFRKFVPTP